MLRLKKRYLLSQLIALFLALILTPKNAYTGNTAMINVFARTTVFESIQISKSNDLDFGLSYTGSEKLSRSASATQGAGFFVSGTANQAYSIVLPTNAVMVTGDGSAPDKKILIDSFISSKLTGQLGANGKDSFQVGATRAPISDSQITGDYAGAFTVTVTYQ